MKLNVFVKAGAKQEKVEQLGPTEFNVWVTQRPNRNQANIAMLHALSRHLNIPFSKMVIIQGKLWRKKVVETFD